MTAAPAAPAASVVELRAIGKEFPGVRALAEVSLSIAPGELLGLVGENGAGKSTLIKILGGVHPAGTFTGAVVVDGVARALRSTRDARAAGIAIVHQELSLVPDMSVADNLVLGREPARLGVVSAATTEAMARALLRDVAGDLVAGLDVRSPARELGVGVQQILEIARALGDAGPSPGSPGPARLVVLDEPTAALSTAETERLFQVIRDRRGAGTSFVYISHHLDEILALTDRVAVLRDGVLVAVKVTAETCRDELVDLMTGKELAEHVHVATVRDDRPPVLEVRGLTVAHPTLRGRVVVDDLSLTVRAGEVVALAGAMGAGRTATLSAVFGLARAGVRGAIHVDGRVVDIRSPRHAILAGLALVPEDRKGQGLVLGMSVVDNLALVAGQAGGWMIDAARVEHAAAARVTELRIKTPSLDAEVTTLSGGNQQKVVIGKWLERAPRVLLLDEPTRGVDIGAKAEIYKLIEDLTARGHAVLIASSDLPEIVRLADRVVVLRDGRRAGELRRGAATGLAIMQLALGARSPAAEVAS